MDKDGHYRYNISRVNSSVTIWELSSLERRACVVIVCLDKRHQYDFAEPKQSFPTNKKQV